MKRDNILRVLTLVVALFAFNSLFAQGVKDLRFNEIVIHNTDGLENEEGQKRGWIEFRNSGYSTVDLGGCQIVMKDERGKEFRTIIPRGTQGATIPPQGYLVIFADPNSDSPLTTEYTLVGAKELYLYDASGKGDHLDKVVIDPRMVKRNSSLSRPRIAVHTKAERKFERAIETRPAHLESVSTQTPGYANYIAPKISRADKLSELDNSGAGLTAVAMFVVFSALLVLFLTFREIGRALQNYERRKEAAKCPAPTQECLETQVATELNGEQLAVIAAAVNLYDKEMECQEDMVLTINRTAKVYSPWSSKIYGLTQTPVVKKN